MVRKILAETAERPDKNKHLAYAVDINVFENIAISKFFSAKNYLK